jgi:hypothetical protein
MHGPIVPFLGEIAPNRGLPPHPSHYHSQSVTSTRRPSISLILPLAQAVTFNLLPRCTPVPEHIRQTNIRLALHNASLPSFHCLHSHRKQGVQRSHSQHEVSINGQPSLNSPSIFYIQTQTVRRRARRTANPDGHPPTSAVDTTMAVCTTLPCGNGRRPYQNLKGSSRHPVVGTATPR